MKLGIIDIGSNTVHLLVVEASKHARPTPTLDERSVVRLMRYLTDDGGISDEGVHELREAVRKAAEGASRAGADELLGMATSALREAANGPEVLAELEEIAGIPLRVLSGQEEADLTFLAARRWHGWAAGRLLVLDIGGGSLEIAYGADERPELSMSVPLGAGRMNKDFLPSDPPTAAERRSLKNYVKLVLGPVLHDLRGIQPDHVVVTSKTFRSLARLAGQRVSVVGPDERRRMSTSDLGDWVDRLGKIPADARQALPGITPERAPQIYAGAVVAHAVMKGLKVDEVEACPWALREGAILERIDQL